jgi:excinuclease ABC subunit A
MSDKRFISIQGAREHNLKNVSLELPRDSLIVFTGLSGSGKSSLAFDTIYAEGQRRYVESLSAYARQFLEMMQKPDVDQIDGLSPAISIEQKTTSRNPRSTVGTVTEIYDYMRLLFARIGIPYSPATGLPIEAQTVTQMVDRVLALAEGTRLYILAPIVRGRKGEYKKDLADLQKKGFQRVKVNGTFHEIDAVPALDKKFKHDIDVVVDRIVVGPDMATRHCLCGICRQAPAQGADLRGKRQQEQERNPRTHHLLRAFRLPRLRLYHRRDRAPPLFLQQSAWRLPHLRWPRH